MEVTSIKYLGRKLFNEHIVYLNYLGTIELTTKF